MNRYVAYSKIINTWNQQQVNKIISREEALAAIQGKYWLAGINAARAVLLGKSHTHFSYISPVREENRGIRYLFSTNPVY